MILERLQLAARANLDRIAIIDGGRRITYAELMVRVQAAQAWFASTLDCGPGDVIAVAMENSWEFAVTFLAVSDLGGILMACNPQWRAAELIPLARRLGLRGVVASPRWMAEWDQVPRELLGAGLFSTAELPSTGNIAEVSPTTARNPDDPALYVCTSGSTGVPRLVPRTHRNLIATIENVVRALAIGPARSVLGVVPFHYSNGLNNSLLVPLFSGARVVIMPKFSPAACAELVRHEQIDTLFGSPFLYGSLLDSVRDPSLLASLQHCYTAGGRIPSGVVERWRERFGVKIRQFYGLTENGIVAAERADADSRQTPPHCVGEVVEGVEVAAFGPDGVPLPAGETGELAIRSLALSWGYLGEPELSRARFRDGYFFTGDLGYVDSEGRLYLGGRIGRGINIAGVKVDPVEIEQAIEVMDAVASCHVDAVAHGTRGDVIRARVVAREGFPITRGEVIEHCRQRLAEYKLPRVIEFLEESPVNLGGKLPKKTAPAVRTDSSPPD